MLQPQRQTLAPRLSNSFLAAENMFPSKIGDVSTTKSSKIKPVVTPLGMVCKLSGTAMAFLELENSASRLPEYALHTRAMPRKDMRVVTGTWVGSSRVLFWQGLLAPVNDSFGVGKAQES